jgi:hypothetical protein
MALTAQQITDIRDDIGDNGASETFTDAEIERAYERTAAVSVEKTRQNATRGILIRQLMANAVKLTKYTAGATSEDRTTIFNALKTMYGMYQPAVEQVEGVGVSPVVMFGARGEHRADRAYPSGFVHNAPEYEGD